jgi:3-methyladenine DNA glycosylase/8-oxoguanine DNA glycosylase
MGWPSCHRTGSTSRRERSRRRFPSRAARTIKVIAQDGSLYVDVVAGSAGARVRDTLASTVEHMFRLDEDLSGFYAVVREDGDLSWCASGAGRMLRAPTVFEDVVKTR